MNEVRAQFPAGVNAQGELVDPVSEFKAYNAVVAHNKWKCVTQTQARIYCIVIY